MAHSQLAGRTKSAGTGTDRLRFGGFSWQRYKLIGYIDANRNRMAYDDCAAEGLPIGSGGIESANKYIHHARLKRSGAWWLKPNANGMLLIRCAVYNGTFNRVFDQHVEFQLELLNI